MVKIGTHSGTFHTDEVFAVMMLRNFVDEYRDAEIVRTRDEEVLKTLDVVVDVGGVYDPSTLRFDHHQRTFNETFSRDFNTRLSSCGLVYRHFSKRILESALKEALSTGTIATNDGLEASQSDEFAVNFYRGFVENIDAVDNGIAAYPKDVKPRHMQPPTDMFARIGRLNGAWWNVLETTPDQRFEQALVIAKEEFLDSLTYTYFCSYYAIPLIRTAIEQAQTYDEGRRIIHLSTPCSWKEALFKVEAELGVAGRTRFVIYKDTSAGGFRVQAVPQELNCFALRTPLKQQWGGLKEKELAEASGLSDAVFCHATGFIGGALSMESCIKMAQMSL